MRTGRARTLSNTQLIAYHRRRRGKKRQEEEARLSNVPEPTKAATMLPDLGPVSQLSWVPLPPLVRAIVVL